MKHSLQYTLLLSALLFSYGCSQVNAPADNSQATTQTTTSTTVQPEPLVQLSKPAPAMEKRAIIKEADAVGIAAEQVMISPQSAPLPTFNQPDIQRERYQDIDKNTIQLVSEQPVSTFSIDVDTGSYSNARRFLNDGYLPPDNAIRAEEFINYFDYDYAAPSKLSHPFSVHTELAPAPWDTQKYLLHIGLKGYEVPKQELPPANLVFLLDVSGSMSNEDKLPLLKKAFQMMSHQLTAQDRISIVTYAGNTAVVLEPTPGDQTADIVRALDQLNAAGSTAGAAGIKLAYQMAHKGFIANGINRILLATDGDLNVGITDFDTLVDMVEAQRESGISISTLGFGRGNYNEQLMEQLADHGNGNYAYIDTIKEGQKVLVGQLSSTLLTIAKDVKIQVEFNPEWVSEYRLIGYENRALNREDFNNDKVDAGEIGAGHTVTALYEIALRDQGRSIEPLRYQADNKATQPDSNEMAFVKLRYKQPEQTKSQLITHPVLHSHLQKNLSESSDNFRFSAAVAAFAQKLSHSHYLGNFGYADITQLANQSKGQDQHGYRGEMIQLVELAAALDKQ